MKLDLEALEQALAGPASQAWLNKLVNHLRGVEAPHDPVLPGAANWRALRLKSPVAERLHPTTVARLEAGQAAYPALSYEPVFTTFEKGEPKLTWMLRRANALLTGRPRARLRHGPVSAPAGYTGLVAQFPPAAKLGPGLMMAERFRQAAPLSHPVWNALLLQLLVLRLHPFMDGNGRTARALVNYELRRHGLLRRPIPIKKVLDANRANDILLRLAVSKGGRPVSAVAEALCFDVVLLTLAVIAGAGGRIEAPELADVAPIAVSEFKVGSLGARVGSGAQIS